MAKPRVAKSNRGRELRAQAALVRLGAQKAEEAQRQEVKPEKEEAGVKEEDESSADEDSGNEDLGVGDAVDINGSKLLDSQGRGMIKICEDEDADDIHVKQEMNELQDLWSLPETKTSSPTRRKSKPRLESKSKSMSSHVSKALSEGEAATAISRGPSQRTLPYSPTSSSTESLRNGAKDKTGLTSITCPVCSMANEPSSWTCAACAHVLEPRLSPGCWKCQSSTCQGGQYLNAGDCGICGICRSRKPE